MQENLKNLPLTELRQMWAKAWGKKPHTRIGRTMLEKSLQYKIQENEGDGFTLEQHAQLTNLIKKYNRSAFDFETSTSLKPGTRLIRTHGGKKHSVLVKTDGFEYSGNIYTSLSKIANDITGKNWNGWVFFGLKKVGKK